MTTLDEIQARADAATPGPWKLWGMTVMADPLGNSNVEESHDIAHTFDPDRGLRTFNADFIRAAREDVPKLVAALRAVDAVCVAFDAGVGLGPGRANEMSHQTKMIRAAIREALG